MRPTLLRSLRANPSFKLLKTFKISGNNKVSATALTIKPIGDAEPERHKAEVTTTITSVLNKSPTFVTDFSLTFLSKNAQVSPIATGTKKRALNLST
jgi:hypothetical protein